MLKNRIGNLIWIAIIIAIVIFWYSYNDPLIEAEPYIEPIETNNIELRRQAVSIVENCPSNNNECYVNEIYRHVVENFNYYPDPRRDELIQTPFETLDIKGGDCEDLTILLNSYLENVGVETYVVLTDTHAYSLACGIDTDSLYGYIQESLINQIARELGETQELEVIVKNGEIYVVNEVNQEFDLDEGEIYYYGGEGSYLESPLEFLDIEYSISSSEPINIYIVPTRDDFDYLIGGESFMHYESCQNKNIISMTDNCKDLDQYGGIIIQNPDFEEDLSFSLEIKFYFKYSDNLLTELFKDQGVAYYNIEKERCVVLDATAGEYGYAGYDGELEGEKIAFNTITRESYVLK